MKMDDRGSAEYQIWEKRDVNVINEVVKSLNDEKLLQCFFSNVKRRTKKREMQNLESSSHFYVFSLERETSL